MGLFGRHGFLIIRALSHTELVVPTIDSARARYVNFAADMLRGTQCWEWTRSTETIHSIFYRLR